MQRKPVLFILAVILFIGTVAWSYRGVWIARDLTYVQARQGVVDHAEMVTAVFACNETVLKAGREGTVEYVPQDGRRVKKGETVAKINGAGVNGLGKESEAVTAPVAGLFFSFRDGREETFTPDHLLEMALDKMAEEGKLAEKIVHEGSVAKNTAIGKVVNNLQASWAFVDLGNTKGILKGDRVRLEIANEEYSAVVMRVAEEFGGVVVKFGQYINGTTEERVQEILWQKAGRNQGVVVPAGALYAQGEELGIYVVENNVIRFRKVKVMDQNEYLVCVENLPEGKIVVENPKEGIQGITVKINF